MSAPHHPTLYRVRLVCPALILFLFFSFMALHAGYCHLAKSYHT